ncbi:hypothetical protein [Streptomyces sp. NPDC102360]|uniref:hypothetical protein n=1 Tax=Streptomyces sp. NPDC102360 TaxID=3366160 RepID=UPI0037FF125C
MFQSRPLRRSVGVAPIALAASAVVLGTAVPAAADANGMTNQPSTVTIAPGETGTANWTVHYDGSRTPSMINMKPTGSKASFNAPGDSTFPAQSTVPVTFKSEGADWGSNNLPSLTGCDVVNGGKRLVCDLGTSTGSGWSWPKNTSYRFTPKVTVDAKAPTGTTLEPGGSLITLNADGGSIAVAPGTLDVATPKSSTPTPTPSSSTNDGGKQPDHSAKPHVPSGAVAAGAEHPDEAGPGTAGAVFGAGGVALALVGGWRVLRHRRGARRH